MTSYQEAIKEYEHTDDSGQHKTIYAYFGLAVYYAQCIEEMYIAMLYTRRIAKLKTKTQQNAREIIEKIDSSRNTMGRFIGEVKQAYSLTDELEKSLKALLETRNFLVHKYFKRNVQKFSSDVGRREMLQYFCDFIEDAKKLEEQLLPYHEKYLHRLGISDDLITLGMQHQQSKERKRDQNC